MFKKPIKMSVVTKTSIVKNKFAKLNKYLGV